MVIGGLKLIDQRDALQLRLANHKRQFTGAIRRIYRHQHDANSGGRTLQQEPFGDVGSPYAKMIASLKTHRHKSSCDSVYFSIKFGPRGSPSTLVHHHCRSIWMGASRVPKDFTDRELVYPGNSLFLIVRAYDNSRRPGCQHIWRRSIDRNRQQGLCKRLALCIIADAASQNSQQHKIHTC